jgi:hypothetical protein
VAKRQSPTPAQRYPLPSDPVQAVRLLMNGLVDTQDAIAALKKQQTSGAAAVPQTITQIVTSSGGVVGVLPLSIALMASNWLNSYDANTGQFTQSQPDYSDIANVPQLPISEPFVTHDWLDSYDSVTGLFTHSRPAAADLSDTPTSGNVLRGNGTAFVSAQLAAADLSNGVTGTGAVVLADSPALTTSPTAPTQTLSDNSTKIATTAFVKGQGYGAATLSGVSTSLNPGSMTAGQRATVNVAVTGATTAMVATCSPTTDPGAGFVWHAFVASANTVTVCLTCVAAGTPAASTYQVRVLT